MWSTLWAEVVHPGWSTHILENYFDRSMCGSPALASFAVAAAPPTLQPAIPEFRYRFHQISQVLFRRMNACVADERTGRHLRVWPELATSHANGPPLPSCQSSLTIVSIVPFPGLVGHSKRAPIPGWSLRFPPVLQKPEPNENSRRDCRAGRCGNQRG